MCRMNSVTFPVCFQNRDGGQVDQLAWANDFKWGGYFPWQYVFLCHNPDYVPH